MHLDSHAHVWNLCARRIPWLANDALRPLQRDFPLSQLRSAAAGGGTDRSVLVQAVADRGETRDLLRLAADSDRFVAGVVGWLDLEVGSVAADIESYLTGAGGRHLVGIRDMTQDRVDPRWLARREVVRNLTVIGSYGLTYDFLTIPSQLPAVTEVVHECVRACPEMLFVVEHLSKPAIAAHVLAPWSQQIRRLAEFPNVACKVSGLVTQARWHDWTVSDMDPYITILLDAFGPERLMFGSDWPVCRLSASYSEVVDLASALMAKLSPSEREQFWSLTAQRFYRLAPAQRQPQSGGIE